jgi:DNA-binding LacI/PurR family transcriptional regulator
LYFRNSIKPDAIFGINDTVVFAAMKEIKKQGFRVPQDISLVGFTDDFHATFMEPELTSMRHPAFEMGQEAAHLLIHQATTDILITPKQIILQPTLVIRESSVKNYRLM